MARQVRVLETKLSIVVSFISLRGGLFELLRVARILVLSLLCQFAAGNVRNIVFCVWGGDSGTPPLAAHLNFSSLVMHGRVLDGIDLRWCELDGADLSGCSLRMAKFVNVLRANFERADLRATVFEGADITGTRFDSADVYGIQLKDRVHYNVEEPPTGLPPEMLAQCEARAPDHPIRKMIERV